MFGKLSRNFLSLYFRLRRWRKALRNWRRFGVIIFGSIFLFSNTGLALNALAAEGGNLEYVSIKPTSVSLQPGETYQFTGYAYDRLGNRLPERPALCQRADIEGAIASAYQIITDLEIDSSPWGIYLDLIISAVQNGDQEQLVQLTSILIQKINSELNLNIDQSLLNSLLETVVDKIIYLAKGVVLSWSMPSSKQVAGTISGKGLFVAGNIPGTYLNAVKLTASQLGAASVATFANITIFVKPEEEEPAPSLQLEFVSIKPTSVSVKVGESYKFTATARDKIGNPIYSGVTFEWKVPASKQDAGSIDSTGNFTAGNKPGTYINAVEITASLEGSASVSSFAKVTVFNVPETQSILSSLALSPSYAVVLEGDKVQFSVSAFDQFGKLMTTHLTITWQVKTGTGTINTSGLYTSPSVDQLTYEYVEVSVSHPSRTAPLSQQAVVEVRDRAPEVALANIAISPILSTLPINSSIQFSAVGYDTSGNAIPGLIFTWSVSGVGQIDPVSGFYASGSQTGSVTVTAQTTFNSQVHQKSLSFEVVDPNKPFLAYLVISPQAVSLNVGETQDFVASAFDQFGHSLAPASWNWALSGAGSIVWNGNQATYTATESGTALITVQALYQGVTQYTQASVVIQGGTYEETLAGVVIAPSLTTLQPNQSASLTATAIAAPGKVIDQNQVIFNWSLEQGGIGTLSPTLGRTTTFTAASITGNFGGAIKVIATLGSESAFASASVIIQPIAGQGVLASVILSPERFSMPTNSSQQLTATAYDTFGNLLSGATFSWQIISGYGSLSGSGSVVQFLSGNIAAPTTIQVAASKDGITVYDTKTISVYTLPDGNLNSVSVSPDPATVQIGGSVQFTASAYDAQGQVLSGVSFSWSVTNSSAGSITSGGYFTASSTTGTFSDLVRVTAYKDGITRYDFATVIIQSTTPGGGSLVGSTLTATLESPEAALDATVRYTLTAHNSGSQTLFNVRAVFPLPTYTRLSSAVSPWGTLQISGRQIFWYVGTLVPGESKTATIRVLINGLPATTVTIRGKATLSADGISAFDIYSNDIVARGPAGGGEVYGPDEYLVDTGLPLLALLISLLSALGLTLLTRKKLSLKATPSRANVIIDDEDEDEMILEL